MQKVKKAVIPAAGFGTRFLPYTKATPKEMLNIVDKPTIQYIVEEAVESGIEDILIILSTGKSSIMDHFDRVIELEAHLEQKNMQKELEEVRHLANLANIYTIRQKEMLGLGHAISMAESFVAGEPFAILLGDDIVSNDTPCLKQLIDCYNITGSSVLGVQRVGQSQVDKYGIIDAKRSSDRTYKLNSLVEKPSVDNAPSNLAILGRYILNASIFDEIKSTEKGKGGEIQLTDAINSLLEKEDIYAYDFIGKRYDAGDKLGYLKATVEFAIENKELGKDFKEYLSQIVRSYTI